MRTRPGRTRAHPYLGPIEVYRDPFTGTVNRYPLGGPKALDY